MSLVNPWLFGEVTIQTQRKVAAPDPRHHEPEQGDKERRAKDQVYNLVKEGQLIAHSHHRPRRGLLINAESVEEFIRRTRMQPQKWLE
jgi:hypothetical protein